MHIKSKSTGTQHSFLFSYVIPNHLTTKYFHPSFRKWYTINECAYMFSSKKPVGLTWRRLQHRAPLHHVVPRLWGRCVPPICVAVLPGKLRGRWGSDRVRWVLLGNFMAFEPKNHPIDNWLVVSTHLKNISQFGACPQRGMKIKNIWNHYPDKENHLPNLHLLGSTC